MTRARAQALRRNVTALETRARTLLRAFGDEGVHVRRQHPVGRYVADFAILKARVAIEVDGPLHEKQREADRERDAYFANLGWRVLRFTTKQVEDADGFLRAVRAVLPPSPRGEGAGGGVSLDASELDAINSEDAEALPAPLPPPLAGRGSDHAFPEHLRRRTRANRKLPSRAKQ